MDNGFRDRIGNGNLPRTSAGTLRARERQDLMAQDSEGENNKSKLRLVEDIEYDENEPIDFPNEIDYPTYNQARLLKTRYEVTSEKLKHLRLFQKKEPQGEELIEAKEWEDEDEVVDRIFKAEQARKRREEGLNRPHDEEAIKAEIGLEEKKLKEIEATLKFLAEKAVAEGEDYLAKLKVAVYRERKNIEKTRMSSVPSTEDMVPDTLDELEFFKEFLDVERMTGTNG